MCTEFLNDLFTKFTDSNVELVFFIDGFVNDEKYRTWSKRQNKKYRDQLKLTDEVYENEMCPREISKQFKYTLYNNGFKNVIEKSCMQFGRVVYAVTHECDKEAASFAWANSRVMAIFSNDSDFLIFPGSWSYYSTKDIEIDSFKTKVFSRAKFRQHLSLTSSQMAVFASIVGNDFIAVESLKSFHQQMSEANKHFTLLVNIANFVKKYHVKFSSKDHNKMVQFFSTAAFRNDSKILACELSKSIEFYGVDGDGNSSLDKHSRQLLKNHQIFTYNVLHCNPFNFSLIFFDLREDDLGNYYDLALPMFKRQAGAILKMNSMNNMKLRVRTKLSHTENYKEFEVEPKFPFFDLPPMEELHSPDESYDTDRHNLLKWIIDWRKLQHVKIETLPEEFFADILTITFMRQQKIITWKEADLLLWTVKNSTRQLIPKQMESPVTLNPRAFRIVFLYVRLYANVERSLEVCGLLKRYGVSEKIEVI